MNKKLKISLWVLAIILFSVAILFWFLRPNHIENTKVGDLTIYTITKSYSDIQLVEQNGNYFLIDAGLAETATELEQSIIELGFDPAKIKAIIITHGHHDHAGGAQYFKQKFGIPIVAGKADVGIMATGKNEKICPTDFLARLRYESDQAALYPPIKVDHAIESVAELDDFVGIKGKIIPIAGHTKGSLVIKIGEIAFVGDMFRGAMLGDGAQTHFYMCDLVENKKDIKALLDEHASDVTLFFMGHFGSASRKNVSKLLID